MNEEFDRHGEALPVHPRLLFTAGTNGWNARLESTALGGIRGFLTGLAMVQRLMSPYLAGVVNGLRGQGTFLG